MTISTFNKKQNKPIDYLLSLTSDVFIILSKDGDIMQASTQAKNILKGHDQAKLSFQELFIQLNIPTQLLTNLDKNDTLIEYEGILLNQEKYHWSIKLHDNYELLVFGKKITTPDLPILLSAQLYQIEKIAACVPGNFYWKNTNSEYLGCNQSLMNMLGLQSTKEIVGKTDYDLWPDQAAAIRAHDQKVMRSRETIYLEEKVTRPAAKDMYFTVIKMPLLDDFGNIVGVLGNSLDITELKNTQYSLTKAKIAAEAASHAKTEFIANMSHDIRTPLNGIIGISSILEETVKNDEQKQYAQWIHESGKQLLDLLNSILDVISADNVHKLDLKRETFDLHQCIQSIANLEKPTIELKGLDLIIQIDKRTPQFIISERSKLHRVLLNLLGNAIKFTDKGKIGIEVKWIGEKNNQVELQFNVMDTGIGIPEDAQAHVFDRFFRVNPSYKGKYAGHGVGLHIVQTYIHLLGGEIHLESKPGIGTQFYFNLTFDIGEPRNLQGPYTNPHKMSQLTENTPIIKKQLDVVSKDAPYILLIEDNLIALHMLESIINKCGCRYQSTSSGEHAFELARGTSFNLIITDIGLPGISGYELTRLIREWELVSNAIPVPIVGLTAHAETLTKQQSLESGMNDVFSKPLTEPLMKKILKQFITTKKTYPKTNPSEKSSENNVNFSGKLGLDLPDSEEELFALSSFPLFDLKAAINAMGSEKMVSELLPLLLSKDINDDIDAIEKAYASKNWEQIEKLTHKMKGGAVYCGTIRMKMVCQYLERYQKAGHTALLEPLYQQLIRVIKNTQDFVSQWLKNQNNNSSIL